ncbi:esterase/lipase family protein [Rhodococcus daqingensis]|uniref:Esterase/lipase family protein n=1 Tax=Rhodococcus daqingensis TaxID=2479363 RepID=A0ABW2S3K2_9NOCA
MMIGNLGRCVSARAGVVGLALVSALAIATGPAGAVPDSGSAAPQVPAGTVVAPPVDCRPTSARPYPVIVLPGADGTTADTAAQWAVMTSALRAQSACTLVFQGGIVNGRRWAGDMPSSARQLAQFVAEVKETTGAAEVDIVAHSAGSFVANYYLKVLGGADVHNVALLAPEARGCDGVGLLAQYGVTDPPVTPVQVLQAMPWLLPVMTAAMPDMAPALQLSPVSEVYRAVMDNGPLTQPGVRYAVIATKNDAVATPAGPCSFITEPGVTNVFYEDVFPGGPAVDHSSLRSSPDAANWVVAQLYP